MFDMSDQYSCMHSMKQLVECTINFFVVKVNGSITDYELNRNRFSFLVHLCLNQINSADYLKTVLHSVQSTASKITF